MQDRPNIDELLGAVQGFLQEEVMTGTSGRLSFHARVAGNVLRWVRRELELQEEHLTTEWAGLDRLTGEAPAMPFGRQSALEAIETRNAELCRRIGAGDYDDEDDRARLLAHLREVTRDKLAVTNPDLIDR